MNEQLLQLRQFIDKPLVAVMQNEHGVVELHFRNGVVTLKEFFASPIFKLGEVTKN